VSVKVKSETDFWSGVLFALCGALAVLISRNYPRGTSLAMGPGYFPTAIGLVLIAVGFVTSAMSLRVEGEKIDRSFSLKAVLAVGGGLILFGWGIERIGFIPSLFGAVLLSTFAVRRFNWKESLIVSVLIVLGCWLIFIVALDLPVPLFWEG
jgi:hypothetical protein